jgi:hypothetical protein
VASCSSCDVQDIARSGCAVGRWSLPRPPRRSPVTRFVLEGAAPRPPSVPRRDRACEPPHLRSSPEPYRSPWPLNIGLLSWVPSACPSTRARRCACRPSIDMLAKRPLPRRRPVVASASRVPPPKSRSARVVSHHLGGFLRFASRGLVASRCRSWGPPRFRIWGPGPKTATFLCFPAVQVRTPRRNPLRQPERVTASVAPLPFPARSPPRLAWFRCRFQVRRGGRIGSVGFEALLRRRVWCSPPPLPVGRRPAPSWASFPFKVLLRGRRSRLPPHRSARHARPGCPERVVAWSRSVPHPLHRRSGEAGAIQCRSTLWRGPRSMSWSLVPSVVHDPKTATDGGQRVTMQPKPHRRGAS